MNRPKEENYYEHWGLVFHYEQYVEDMTKYCDELEKRCDEIEKKLKVTEKALDKACDYLTLHATYGVDKWKDKDLGKLEFISKSWKELLLKDEL